ncbi:hypothetical protein SISSUDRAFT_432557 [Sistotremastrum suecicum HHB10207 ss-3]|uniref:Uncharacterized protein n=1 Tax=Sistotremastrum suecicum HHB10207 ss-3 TaxID=1314776 RepID=A0A165YGI9_9AGAM|nr:hypothetical protein SISSUDRAFT_432557 [Sistotremastrum suecicum HHB10207 ss-3]
MFGDGKGRCPADACCKPHRHFCLDQHIIFALQDDCTGARHRRSTMNVSFAVHNFPALEHAVSNSQQPLLIIDLETIVDELEERMKRHGYAKSLIILYVNELQRRLDAELPWPEYVYHGSRRFSPSSPGSFPCRTHRNEKILIRTSHYTRALQQDRTAQRDIVRQS